MCGRFDGVSIVVLVLYMGIIRRLELVLILAMSVIRWSCFFSHIKLFVQAVRGSSEVFVLLDVIFHLTSEDLLLSGLANVPFFLTSIR